MHSERLSDPAVVAHYESDIGCFPEMLPMLQLVQCLAQKPYADFVPAGTSHNTLVLGAQNAITITYLSHIQCFEIQYHSNDWKAEIHRCFAQAAEGLIDALVLRQYMSTPSTQQ